MDISTGDGAPQNAPVNFGVDPGGGWEGDAPANAARQDVEPDWGVKPGNDPAPEWADSSPSSAAPSGKASAGAEIPSVAAQPPAPLTDLEIGHAALICGYSAQKSANPLSDAELAQHFGTSPNVIAARRNDFLRRYVIVTARDALSTSPVLCRAIRNNPSIGSQVQPDVPHLAVLENTLAQVRQPEERSLAADAWAGVENFVLKLAAFAHATQKYNPAILAMETAFPEAAARNNDFFDFIRHRANEEDHSPQRWLGQITSGVPYALFGPAAPFVAGGTEGYSEAKNLEDQGVDPVTAYTAGGLKGLILGAAQKVPLGNLKWGEGVEAWLKSLAGTSVKAGAVGAAQSAMSNAATGLALHAGGYPKLGGKYWERIPEDALDSALFMLGIHLGGQGIASVITESEKASGATTKEEIPAPELLGSEASDDAPAPVPQDAARHEQARAALADGGRASDAVQAYDTLLNISEQAQRTTLSKSNPFLLSEIVQGMADKGPLREFYVDGEALAPVLEKSGKSPEEMEAILPGVNEAIQASGSVRVPIEALATHPFLKETLPHARIAPDAMSYAEARGLVNRHAENIVRQADEAAANKSAEGAAPHSAHPLFSDAEREKYQRDLRKMSPGNRDIAERFAKRLEDHESSVAEYSRLEEGQGGKALNTDIARELCEDYLKDRSKGQVIQRLASAFVRKMYADKLASVSEPVVLFSAGGPGSGKSTVLSDLPEMAKAAANADIIYDTTMSHYESARGMIEQALNAGGTADIVLVIREPIDALVNGAIRRAVAQERKHGSGRTVTLDYFLNAHPNAIRNVFRLAEEYKDHPDVKFRFIDNTHGYGNTVEVSLEQARQIEFKDVEPKARAALEKEYRDGRISEKIYKGFKFGENEP